MPDEEALGGFVTVDKPAGMTSHDVVARCRRLLSTRRVGHAGTLDPDVTGVLVVAAGRATRLIRFLGPLPKTYEGTFSLGTATDTLDASGRVVGTWDMSGVTPAQVAEAAAALTGPILQVPPMVSAVQVGGRRLHELARQGVEVEREPRPVTIHSFDVEADGVLSHRFRVSCSSGTYVRSLVDDLGKALGGGAHLTRLRRTAVGPFVLDGAVALGEVSPDRLDPPEVGLSFLDRVVLEQRAATDVSHGRPLDRQAIGAAGDGPWAVLDGSDALLAVYERAGERSMRAAVVLRPAGGAR